MEIYILSAGRAGRQVTLKNLSPELQERCILIVPPDQVESYAMRYPNVIAAPNLVVDDYWKGVGHVRRWIIENAKTDHVCMLDDDLRFYTRRKDKPGNFLYSTRTELNELFDEIDRQLNDYAHVGVLAREGGNRTLEPYRQATRMMRVLAYNTKVVRPLNVQFDRLQVMEDFDATLQLLRLGYPNLVICGWVQGQGTSNEDGGCSTYRTMEVHGFAARQLSKLHTPFVTVKTKQTKSAWGGQPREDVVIQWQRAYESSK